MTSNSEISIESDLHIHYTTPLQSIFHGVNLLMGMGILTIPYAFKLLGIPLGICMLLIMATIACSTAIYLTCPDSVPEETEPLLGTVDCEERMPLLPAKKNIIELPGWYLWLFSIELVIAAMAMLILFSDTYTNLFHLPYQSIFILASGILLSPTLLLSIRSLSSVAFVGILALLTMIFALCIEAVVQWKTVHFNLGNMGSWSEIGLGVGLLFVGFDGHGVFQSLQTDLHPSHSFKRVLIITYSIVTVVYIGVGVVGFTIWGDNVNPEFTLNLTGINYIITMGVVGINPITKFALLLRPITTNLALLLKIKSPLLPLTTAWIVTISAITFPSFHKVTGFLGASLSIIVAVFVPGLLAFKSHKIWSSFILLAAILGISFGLYGVLMAS